MPTLRTRWVLTSTAVVAALVAGSAAVMTVVAPSASAASTTFTPTADTYVNSTSPNTNYGSSTQLGVDASEVKHSFLKYDVSGITEPIASVKLRLHVDDVAGAESNNGGTWKLMSNTAWVESSVTYNAQPAIDGATLGTLGNVARNSWVELDLTGKITGNGTFSIGGLSTSSNGADYDSRESGATAPQLVITTGITPSPSPTTTTTPPAGDPVIVAAGDITSSGSGDSATWNIIKSIGGDVITLGDNAYSNGLTSDFSNYYQPTWGQELARTHPAPGNHDYNTANASGYFGYFGTNAGPSGRGYYSFDLGNWHIVSLDSEIARDATSAQVQWLVADLAASTKSCTLAYWHKPLFTSGSNHAPDSTQKPLFQALYDANADLVLNGHNHQYERFAPMNPSGAADSTRGIREFVVGTGGDSHYSFGTIQPNSQARNSDTYGVLKLTLHSNSYDWQFVPESGKTYNDNGTGTCH